MKNTQDNQLNKSKIIRYNNAVMDDKDTNIICTIFKEDGRTLDNVAVFTLNYNLKEGDTVTPYQVVLGKIELKDNNGNLVSKVKVVEKYLLKQLKENKKGANNYKYCQNLMYLCKKYNIPYIYTEEGISVLTNDSEETKTFEKSYRVEEKNEIIELICLNQNKKMDIYESELNIRRKIDQKIKSNKVFNEAMKELQDEQQKRKFIIGKEVNDLRYENSKEVIIEDKRQRIIDYLIAEYENNKGKCEALENHKMNMQQYLKLTSYLKNNHIKKTIDPNMVIGEEDKETNAEKYFRLKEKGIAIDIKKMLESSQEETIDQQSESGEETEEQKNKNDYINKCKTIFDFIKMGKDFNTQFCYEHTIDGFGQLYSIIEEQKDKKDENGNLLYNIEEILEYLRMKEEKLKTIKLDKKKSFLDYELYSKNGLVRKFMRFVMESEVRLDTRLEEKEVLFDIYQDMVNKTIENHTEEIKLYNIYAEKYNADICPIPEENENMNEVQNENEQDVEER